MCKIGRVYYSSVPGLVGLDMQWNWDNLRFFLALAEHGTLSLAGRSLEVSHSTVQRRVHQFEAQLQVQLFDHTSEGYLLTSAGKLLHEEAVKMHGTFSAISRTITGADKQLAGEIIITTTDTLALFVLPKLIAKLSRKYPGIQFFLSMDNGLSNINDREADIAIRTSKVPPENLIGRKVGSLQFCAVASPSYIKRKNLNGFPKNVEDHTFVVLDESYSSAPFYKWLDARVKKNSIRYQVNSFLSAAALVREGMGISVLPSYMVEKNTGLVELKPATVVSSNDLWVLSHADLRDTEKVRVVRQYFYDELPRLFE